jgi:hypothetical protein
LRDIHVGVLSLRQAQTDSLSTAIHPYAQLGIQATLGASTWPDFAGRQRE